MAARIFCSGASAGQPQGGPDPARLDSSRGERRAGPAAPIFQGLGRRAVRGVPLR
jgi:hypothetical protein